MSSCDVARVVQTVRLGSDRAALWRAASAVARVGGARDIVSGRRRGLNSRVRCEVGEDFPNARGGSAAGDILTRRDCQRRSLVKLENGDDEWQRDGNINRSVRVLAVAVLWLHELPAGRGQC